MRLPGNKPAAWRMAAGILVVPLLVRIVSFAFTVRIILLVFLRVYLFPSPKRKQSSRWRSPFSPGSSVGLMPAVPAIAGR
jgi:hypothetical protein